MSISDRIDNEGLLPRDAAMKESLKEGEPLREWPDPMAGELRCRAIDAEQRMRFYAGIADALRAAASRIEAQDKRFAEHLAAWKANNAHHAARIVELEKQLAEATKYLNNALTRRQ